MATAWQRSMGDVPFFFRQPPKDDWNPNPQAKFPTQGNVSYFFGTFEKFVQGFKFVDPSCLKTHHPLGGGIKKWNVPSACTSVMEHFTLTADAFFPLNNFFLLEKESA